MGAFMGEICALASVMGRNLGQISHIPSHDERTTKKKTQVNETKERSKNAI